MDVFSRLMMDRVMFLGTAIESSSQCYSSPIAVLQRRCQPGHSNVHQLTGEVYMQV